MPLASTCEILLMSSKSGVPAAHMSCHFVYEADLQGRVNVIKSISTKKKKIQYLRDVCVSILECERLAKFKLFKAQHST